MRYVDFPEIRVARQNFLCHSYFKAKPQESKHHGNYCFKDCIIVYMYVFICFHISIYSCIPRMWRQSHYNTQYICWITDVI